MRAKVFAALSDPTRLRMVELLLCCPGEMSGKQIAKLTGISMALLCHHWRVLAESGVITKEREGQTTYCAVNRGLLSRCIKSLE